MQRENDHVDDRVTLATARELFDESRQLFDAGCMVASRGPRPNVASAPLFKKSLHLLLTIVARLEPRGDASRTFEDTVRRAREISDAKKIFPYDFESRVLFIGKTSDRFFDPGDTIPDEDLRRYDYDVDWLPDLYRDVWRYAEKALTTPADRERIRRRNRRLATLVGALAVLGGGYGIYRHVTRGALRGSYYRDETFGSLAYQTRDDRIAFDWGRASPRGLPPDHFSIRWEGSFNAPQTARYTFSLESDDGSRLFIDDAQVIDNWGPHARTTVDGEVELTRGVHRIKVEYFDSELDAFVELSWASPSFARRVMSGGDFR